MQQEQNDNLIIQQVLQGRQSAYALLVSRHQSYVFSLVLRYVPNREEAEELAQDVFIKAYRCLADFRAESKFSTWLYTIVHTTCITHLRKKPSRIIMMEEDQLHSAAAGHHATADANSQTEQRSRKALMEAVIGHLGSEDASIILLFYQAEQTLEEIATILGIPSNTVKVKLHRARHKLRQIMEQKFNSEIPYLTHS